MKLPGAPSLVALAGLACLLVVAPSVVASVVATGPTAPGEAAGPDSAPAPSHGGGGDPLRAAPSEGGTTGSMPGTSSGGSTTSTRFVPGPSSHVNPLLGYSHEPAPMGIADFGVTGNTGNVTSYDYATSSFEGTAHVNSMDVSIPFHTTILKVTAFELNVVLVLRLNGTNYTYWIQNGLHVNASSRLFTIGGAYVWNFSSPSAHLSSSELRGNSSSVLATDTYYFIPGCGGFAGQCSTLTWPGSFSGRVLTSIAGGTPYVAYQYDLGAGWVTYDNVSFLHMVGADDVGFVVDGHHPTPIGSTLFYDAEWDWGAAGGGLSSVVKSSDLQMSLDFWNGRNYQAVPDAWDFGGNTGETSSNVTEAAHALGTAGVPGAFVANGAGSLGVLYNGSEVGYLNVTVPSELDQLLEVNGTPFPVRGGGLNLTLAGGGYTLSLQNYSNASVPVTVVPGSTTFVNLSGAGRTAFREVGLPTGTPWGISIGGSVRSSSSPTLVFQLPNGTYPVSYTAVPGFSRDPASPSMLTIPTASPVEVRWTPFNYSVPVNETGLPPSTIWWVTIGGVAQTTQGTGIVVSAPNGSTPFEVGSSYAFVATPAAGWINITNGRFDPVDVEFTDRPTFIAGTVVPVSANVTIDGIAVDVIGGAFNDSVLPGAHTLVASATGYATQTIPVEATPGNVSEEPITLARLPLGTGTVANSGNGSGLSTLVVVGAVGVAAAAIVGVAAFVLWRRARRR